jgi:hypothetical protein
MPQVTITMSSLVTRRIGTNMLKEELKLVALGLAIYAVPLALYWLTIG